jgi:hypothetical protein
MTGQGDSPTGEPSISKLDGELHNESGTGALLPQGGNGENLVSIPMTEEEVGQWQQRIQQATDRRKETETSWDVLLRSYLPKVKDGPVLLKVMLHFRNVHSKIGQLFYRSPEMILTPRGPSTDQLPAPPMAGAPPVRPLHPYRRRPRRRRKRPSPSSKPS